MTRNIVENFFAFYYGELFTHMAIELDVDLEDIEKALVGFNIGELIKKPKKKKIENKPKRPGHAFTYYAQENRRRVMKENPQMIFDDIGKKLGQEWKGLTDKDKVKYDKIAWSTRIRYVEEMKKFDPNYHPKITKNIPEDEKILTQIELAKKTNKYYNLSTKRQIKKTDNAVGKYVFYDQYAICVSPQFDENKLEKLINLMGGELVKTNTKIEITEKDENSNENSNYDVPEILV